MGAAVLNAAEWNRLYPAGTLVLVTKADGSVMTVRTASLAQRVGEHDFIELEGFRGLWLLSWCKALAEPF